jgi:hypothetical protein
VILWVVLIYTTIPFVRALREWFAERWDPHLIGWAVAVLLAAAAVIALARFRSSGVRPRGADVVWVVTVTAAMIAWAFSLRRSPEEAVHLIEYGILAILIHRALTASIPDGLVFVAGSLIGILAGTVDEMIQWLSPNRFWDWRDVVLNGGASALVQLALWRLMPQSKTPVARRSWRMVFRLTAALSVVMILCLANTPERVARYAPALPGFDHLRASHNPMAEYGHRHEAPGIGVFKSRLTIAELARTDQNRSKEVAEIVDEYRNNYGRFLDIWPFFDDPFPYEMRVHLFSRNRNVGRAREAGFESRRARPYMTIAWRENRLLEEYFGTSLSDSSYSWPDRLRRRIEAGHDTASDFESAAGSHLITFASEGGIRTALLIVIALLVVADRALAGYHGHTR